MKPGANYTRGKCHICGFSVRYVKPYWQKKLGTHYVFEGTKRIWCHGSLTIDPAKILKNDIDKPAS